MRLPEPRLFTAWARKVAPSVACVLLALPMARPTAADLPTPRSAGHALRKDASAEPSNDESPSVATWATLFNTHTGEAIPLSGEEPSAARFSETLADRTTGSQKELDPRLLELLRQIALRNPGRRIELVSGYRSPKLNEMLRKKGHRVASHSQHSLGHAVDFRIIGLSPADMKKEILRAGWDGGIGQYDKSSDLFVHADVGPKREWFEGGGR
ncbi:MAG TPA: DUF882 domain-containing protein [Polyangiaceae bacterium]|nr:DUF882 domain-containing protein [Polyangiaceae bacterium]